MTAFLPPALTHPEHFHGFLMVAIAWQVAFLVLARDPERLRPLMPVAILEKVLYVGSQAAMVATGRAALPLLGVVAIDGTFALLFLAAWRRTRSR